MGDGPPGFRRNFTCSAVLRIHSGENEVLTTGLLPPMAGLSRPLHLPRSFVTPYRVSTTPRGKPLGLGWSVSLAATQGIAFAFSSSGYLDVSVPGSAFSYPMYSDMDTTPLRVVGFHSEISGSKLAYSSPKHIGVRPVLHRLLVPRHPPCALSNLTVKKNHYVISCITN